MSDKILVINTGGTIDAEPYKGDPPENITPLPVEKSIIAPTLDGLGFKGQYHIEHTFRADSKDFTQDELRKLALFIQKQDFDKVIIVHGTDHMAQNGRTLQNMHKAMGQEKRIVFTGAMVPIMNDILGNGESDGYANLQFAIEQVKTAKRGVYIGFKANEELLDPLYTVKDRANKAFVKTDTPVVEGRSE